MLIIKMLKNNFYESYNINKINIIIGFIVFFNMLNYIKNNFHEKTCF